jgi:hypothetical protein
MTMFSQFLGGGKAVVRPYRGGAQQQPPVAKTACTTCGRTGLALVSAQVWAKPVAS